GPGVYNLTSFSSRGIFTLKLRNNGDFVWARKAGSGGLPNGRAITTDAQGNVYTAAEIHGTSNMHPTGNYPVPGNCAVQKLDSSGNFVWAVGWEGSIPGWIGLDKNDNIYITGNYDGAASGKDFDPGPGVYYLNGKGGFILKLCQDTFPVLLDATQDTICAGDTAFLLVIPI